MSRSGTWWLMLPRPVRRLPADLAAVVALVVLTLLSVTVPGVRETPLRVVVGLPFVLFCPGYALLAALFPEASTPVDDEDARESGIDGLERVALSFGLSIAVVPLLGLALNFTPWGIRLLPVALAVGAVTTGSVVLAAVRRWALPPEERFSVPYRSWVAAGRRELFEPASRADAALNVLLVVALLLAVSTVGYAVLVPSDGERFTEFYLLTENEDGDRVADGYPQNFTVGESQSVIVGVGNHEHEPTRYAVVVQLQRVETVNNSTRVLDREEIDRFTTPEIAANESWQQRRSIDPTMTGERLRLQYLLYRGSAPEDASEATAYRDLHLWVNVTR
ncbi:hypothetical protein BV210_05825 [Halorientalis sp. IM1011]|uniref:DUF1616 domain-containing protein n=1 Tax=Halorientalis sp. IM1011 TaxID=1932360 RepID=UPI00097CCC72|nr:DUF1616 domain-containing protein [Halorientalis sp. IM1011]AQL42260.1 hypothetical protein BV210_05825 [Halorientalis sp. IM1011]